MLKLPRYYARVDCFLHPTHINEKIHYEHALWQVNQKQSVSFFPLGLCGGNCTVLNLYRSKHYLHPYLKKAALYPKYGVQGTWMLLVNLLEDLLKTKTWHWPTLGFCASCLLDLSPLSLSLSLSSSFPPLLGALFYCGLPGFHHWVLQRRASHERESQGKEEKWREVSSVSDNRRHSWMLVEFLFKLFPPSLFWAVVRVQQQFTRLQDWDLWIKFSLKPFHSIRVKLLIIEHLLIIELFSIFS